MSKSEEPRFETNSLNWGHVEISPSIYRKVTIKEPLFDLESFVTQLKLKKFHVKSKAEKEEFLAKFDALDLYKAFSEISNNLTESRLENYLLTNFLKKNDIRFQFFVFKPSLQSVLSVDNQSMARSTRTTSRYSVAGMSLYSHAQPSMATSIRSDFKLKSIFKSDLADKSCAEVDRRQQEYKLKANQAIKSLNAKIEEAHMSIHELEGTYKNFELHFFRDENDIVFLRTANERNLDRKFRKFVDAFISSGRNIISKMGLRLVQAYESCQVMRADMQLKSQLGAILSSADFDVLANKRNMMSAELDEKNMHLAGLKAISARAALLLSEEYNKQNELESISKSLNLKNIECIKCIGILEKEAIRVQDGNIRDLKRIQNLYEQLSKFEAPSVNEYIRMKNELFSMEKEDKMLNRKMHILNMKLKNLQKKLREKKISF